MSASGARTDETSLRRKWGFPYGGPSGRGRASVFAAVGLTVATWGLLTAAAAVPEPGLDFDPPPGRVLSVLPGGPAWRDGIRPGQAALSVSRGDDPLDWKLRALGDGVEYALTLRGVTAELRGLVPLAMLAVLTALLAAAATFRAPRPAVALASLAGMAASVPLLFGGQPIVSSIGGLLALGLPAAGIIVGVPGTARTVVALAFTLGMGSHGLSRGSSCPAGTTLRRRHGSHLWQQPRARASGSVSRRPSD